MESAWNFSKGDNSVILAIIDSGTDYDHDDLNGNLWNNDDEVSGVADEDDDGNGYVDDFFGWDFEDDDNDPMDEYFHGTATAGIAVARSNNSEGIAGIAGGWGDTQGVQMMVLRLDNSSTISVFAASAAEAITYAAENGADVMNMSIGWADDYAYFEGVVEDAVDDYDCVLVASAGNNGGDNSSDRSIRYPAKYPDVIAVGATVQNDTRWTTSGTNGSAIGSELDVMAPGGALIIWTTDISGSSGASSGDYNSSFGGTSASAPHVAGLASLLRSQNPSWDHEDIKDQITRSAIYSGDDERDNYYGYGRIDAEKALRNLYVPDQYSTIASALSAAESGRRVVVTAGTHTVSSHLTVSSGITLEIEPGATLEFSINAILNIYGTLKAEGTSGNMITFDKSGASNWGGIKFYDSSADNSCKLEYCLIQNAIYGVWCSSANPTIENCTIQNCVHGIYIYYPDASTDNIKYNIISDMTGYGIRQWYGTAHTNGNNISACSKGIGITGGFNTIIEADTIHDNTNAGIWMTSSDPLLCKNLIYDNEGDGISCISYSDLELRDDDESNDSKNVVAWNDENGIYIDDTSLPFLNGYSSVDGNSLYSNNRSHGSYYDILSEQSSTVSAGKNWWGNSPPNEDKVSGEISQYLPLSSDPNPNPHDLDKLLPISSEPVSNDRPITQSLPSNADAHKIFYEGYLLQADQKYVDALDNFKTVIANYPESFESTMALSRVQKCLKRSERLGELGSYLNSIYEPNKNRLLGGMVLEMQTSLLVKNKSFNEALANCETIIKDFPDGEIAKNALLAEYMIYFNDLNDLGAAKTVMDEYGSKYGDDEDYIFMMLEMGEITSEQAEALLKSQSPTDNDQDDPLPVSIELADNYPNPFNPETKIQIKLPKDSDVKLQIFNIRGQVVATPFEGNLPAGSHTVNFNASALSSGVYFYKIVAGEFSDVKRMVLVK